MCIDSICKDKFFYFSVSKEKTIPTSIINLESFVVQKLLFLYSSNREGSAALCCYFWLEVFFRWSFNSAYLMTT